MQWFEHLTAARVEVEESAYRRVEWVAVSLVCDHYHCLSAETRYWTSWTLYGWARGTNWLTSWLHGLHVLLYCKNDFLCPVKGVWLVGGKLNNLWWGQNNFELTEAGLCSRRAQLPQANVCHWDFHWKTCFFSYKHIADIIIRNLYGPWNFS